MLGLGPAYFYFLVKAAVSYLKAVNSEAFEEIDAAVAEEAPDWKELTRTGVGREVKTR